MESIYPCEEIPGQDRDAIAKCRDIFPQTLLRTAYAVLLPSGSNINTL